MFVPCDALISSWLAAYPNATAAQKAAFCAIVSQCVGSGGDVTIGVVPPAAPPAAGGSVLYLNQTTGTLYVWAGAAWVSTSQAAFDLCDAVQAAPAGVLAKAFGLTAAGGCSVEDIVQGQTLAQQLAAIPAGQLQSVIGFDASGAPSTQTMATAFEAGNLSAAPLSASSLAGALSDGIGSSCVNSPLQSALLGLVFNRATSDALALANFASGATAASVPAATYPPGAGVLVADTNTITITNPATSCRNINVHVLAGARVYNAGPATGDPTQYDPVYGEIRCIATLNGTPSSQGSYSRTDHTLPGESSESILGGISLFYNVAPGDVLDVRIEVSYRNPYGIPQVIDAGQSLMSLPSELNSLTARWS